MRSSPRNRLLSVTERIGSRLIQRSDVEEKAANTKLNNIALRKGVNDKASAV